MNTNTTDLNIDALREGLRAKAREQGDEFGEAIILLQRGKAVLEKVEAATQTLEANIEAFVEANGGKKVVQAGLSRGEFVNLALANMRLAHMREGLDGAREEVKKAEETVAKFTVI